LAHPVVRGRRSEPIADAVTALYDMYSEFQRSLKTFLFGQWGHGAV